MGLGELVDAEIARNRTLSALNIEALKLQKSSTGLMDIASGLTAGVEMLVDRNGRNDLADHDPIKVTGEWKAVQMAESHNPILGNTFILTLGQEPISQATSIEEHALKLKEYGLKFIEAHPGIKAIVDKNSVKEVRLVFRAGLPAAK